MNDAIRAFVNVPPRIATFAKIAREDMYDGPCYVSRSVPPLDGEWFGAFDDDRPEDARAFFNTPWAKELRDWIAALPTLYYDPDWDGVTDSEGQGEWIEDEGERYYWERYSYREITPRQVAEALFGRAVAEHYR